MTPDQYAAAAAAEVRAEMGRQRKSITDLAEVLDVTRPTAESRFKGERPFDLIELARVAVWLGVPVSRFAPSNAQEGVA